MKTCIICQLESPDKGFHHGRCFSCRQEYNRIHRAKLHSLGLCSSCGKNPQRDPSKRRSMCQPCLDKSHEQNLLRGKRWRQDKRQRILNHYGAKCVCCGETTSEFLTIDHINNDGAKLRREKVHPPSGDKFYAWIVEQGFPETFQILCMNCNWAKGKYGGCPHQKNY